ncbi:ExeA family protein [Colwelliaceae bacterium BS250]
MQSGYTAYFGLNDIPFSIAPNPHYLFMSERHKEALAHLTHGLGETGGFVLLTGEVGTGKTTVSKCLLEQLPENTEAAFILNPTLSAKELLATICDELHINYEQQNATLKTFTDKILSCLINNHQQGKSTLLIIDEAQHLQPEVLEQLRLLTNLETHTKKLLQVILIGQPELQEVLKRRDLRQLAQRITARYHLLPLNKAEVSRYIKHRLSVAGCQHTLFSPASVSLIHQLSNGVPRLINLLCDRALLGAYSIEQTQVSRKIIQQACRETLGEQFLPVSVWQNSRVKKIAAVSSLLLCAAFGFNVASQQTQTIAIAEQQLQNQQEQHLLAIKTQQLNQVPNQLVNSSRLLSLAFKDLYSQWQVELFSAANTPCDLASSYQLECYWYSGNAEQFFILDYPAIVRFIDGKGQYYFATYKGHVDGNIQLLLNGDPYQVSEQWFVNNWQGSAVILWRAPQGFVETINEQSDPQLLLWLEQQLSQKQHRSTRNVISLDALLINQLQQYQQTHGLSVSTFADVKTVMMLSKIEPEIIGDNQ